MQKDFPVFYTEAYVPNKWFLSDALQWVGMKRLPEVVYFGLDETEARESFDTFIEHIFSVSDRVLPAFMLPEETYRIGIGIDPEWLAFSKSETGELYSRETYTGEIARQENANKTESYKRSEEGFGRYIRGPYVFDWVEDLDDYLDPSKSELYLKLKKGKIVAEGILLPFPISDEKADGEKVYDFLAENVNSQSDYQSAFQPIPADKWLLKQMDWKGSILRTRNTTYLAVRFNYADIINLFPPVKSEKYPAYKTGSILFTTSGKAGNMNRPSRVGRPSKNWEAVYVKIAQICAEQGGLPKKQDALAQEIMDWYKVKFGQDIGLSTVKAKVKIYYESLELK